MRIRLWPAALASIVSLAAPAAAHYVAVPEVAQTKIIPLQGLVWQCDAGACTAEEGRSRPEVVCASLAKKVGAVRSFAAGDRVFDAAALKKCNARTKS